MKKAYFAGGCFWCVEHDLRAVTGVVEVLSGYSGEGDIPSYESHRGFAESVEVEYDPEKSVWEIKILQEKEIVFI